LAGDHAALAGGMSTEAVSRRELRARALDKLAEIGLGMLTPLVVEATQDPRDVDEALRLRYDCVVDLGWASAADFPDGRAADAWDGAATFVVCREAGRLIGALRLVAPQPDRPLPTEHDFDLRLQAREELIDAGRLVTRPQARAGRTHYLLAGLLARGWLTARAMGYDRVVSAASPALIEYYRGLGMGIDVLGPPRRHWGAERAPIEIRGSSASFAFMGRLGDVPPAG
jgi:N-acyl-L-homoserine lactone synthetase